jgi:hypothetical protein
MAKPNTNSVPALGDSAEAPTSATSARGPAKSNWEAFNNLGLIPKQIVCHAYKPVHQSDESCHTRLRFDTKTILAHVEAGHGGAFQFDLRRSDGKQWNGWADLKAAGVEIHDLRCEVCDAVIRPHETFIEQHLRPHRGKFRFSNQDLGKFNITVSYKPAPPETDNDDEDFFS